MVSGMILVRAQWDPESGVYVATSEDVPGLVAEAASPVELVEKLQVLVPELLELNSAGEDDSQQGTERTERHWTDIPMVVLAEQISKVRVFA